MIEPLLLAKLVAIGGLAVWLSIIVLNNIRNFPGGAISIGMMMSMKLFQDPPAIDTPLLSRRVVSPSWHRAVLALVLSIEILVALALWAASFVLLRTMSGAVPVVEATDAANLALAGFLTLVFAMMWGGAWFAYYIKQEESQITHLTLLCVGLAAVLVVNIPIG